MTSEQQQALASLKAAHALYRQADEHRSELIGLCKALDVPLVEIEKAVEIDREERS